MNNSSAQRRIPITLKALVQRLKRHHAQNAETFHVTRGTRWYSDLGCFYAVDSSNYVSVKWGNVEDVEAHARDVGVLGSHEVVAL